MIKNHAQDPTGIQVFNHEMFGQIRTLTNEQGETFFVGKDVVQALGYKNISKALADHVAADDVTKSYPIVDSLGRRQEVSIINESGLYALILGSKLPNAKVFKHWVTSEVLPQIRRTGGYIPTRNARTGARLSAEEIVETAFGIMQKTISHENLPADGCFSTREVAKEYGMLAKDFYSFLTDQGIVRWVGGRYQLTPKYAGRGYDKERIHHSFSLDGRPKVKPYLVWTQAGRAFIENIARKGGVQ